MNGKILSRVTLGLTLSLGFTLGTLAMARGLGTAFLDTGAPASDDSGTPPTDTGSGPEDTGGSTDDTGGSTDDTGGSTDDTGGSTDDTGGSTDDTGGSADDTGTTPSDDTATPEDTGGDDTGTTMVDDSGVGIGLSAAELAGEKGGCSCATGSGGAALLGFLPLLALLGFRRRD